MRRSLPVARSWPIPLMVTYDATMQMNMRSAVHRRSGQLCFTLSCSAASWLRCCRVMEREAHYDGALECGPVRLGDLKANGDAPPMCAASSGCTGKGTGSDQQVTVRVWQLRRNPAHSAPTALCLKTYLTSGGPVPGGLGLRLESEVARLGPSVGAAAARQRRGPRWRSSAVRWAAPAEGPAGTARRMRWSSRVHDCQLEGPLAAPPRAPGNLDVGPGPRPLRLRSTDPQRRGACYVTSPQAQSECSPAQWAPDWSGQTRESDGRLGGASTGIQPKNTWNTDGTSRKSLGATWHQTEADSRPLNNIRVQDGRLGQRSPWTSESETQGFSSEEPCG
jgi:hypothetical protein